MAGNLPLFSPFVQPKAVIFPQHCDIHAISTGRYRDTAATTSTGMEPASFSNFGKPATPSADWVGQAVTEFVANEDLANFGPADQTDLNLTLSIGKGVVATGAQYLTGDIVSNLLLWTQGPPAYQSKASGGAQTGQWVLGYFFVNMTLLGKKYGVTVTEANSFVCDITFNDLSWFETAACWAEAIPHCRHCSFGVPNSLISRMTGSGAPQNVNAAAMGWADAHQAVNGWAKGNSGGGSGTASPEFNGVMALSAYNLGGGAGYNVSMTGSGWPSTSGHPSFSTTNGTGSD